MDSLLAPLIVEESARPYSCLRGLLATERAYTKDCFNPAQAGRRAGAFAAADVQLQQRPAPLPVRRPTARSPRRRCRSATSATWPRPATPRRNASKAAAARLREFDKSARSSRPPIAVDLSGRLRPRRPVRALRQRADRSASRRVGDNGDVLVAGTQVSPLDLASAVQPCRRKRWRLNNAFPAGSSRSSSRQPMRTASAANNQRSNGRNVYAAGAAASVADSSSKPDVPDASQCRRSPRGVGRGHSPAALARARRWCWPGG